MKESARRTECLVDNKCIACSRISQWVDESFLMSADEVVKSRKKPCTKQRVVCVRGLCSPASCLLWNSPLSARGKQNFAWSIESIVMRMKPGSFDGDLLRLE